MKSKAVLRKVKIELVLNRLNWLDRYYKDQWEDILQVLIYDFFENKRLEDIENPAPLKKMGEFALRPNRHPNYKKYLKEGFTIEIEIDTKFEQYYELSFKRLNDFGESIILFDELFKRIIDYQLDKEYAEEYLNSSIDKYNSQKWLIIFNPLFFWVSTK